MEKPASAGLRTGQQALLREINLSLIINQIRKRAPVARADLAKMLGLTKTTVSSLVGELQQKGYVKEIGFNDTSTPGRPSMMLQLNPEAGFFVSAELGSSMMRVIATNFAAEVVWESCEPIHKQDGQSAILAALIQKLKQGREAGLRLVGKPLGIALGIQGFMNHQTGVMLYAMRLDWRNVPLREILMAEFHEPVHVYNASYLAALAEYYNGAGENYQNMLYLMVTTGLGGTLVHKGLLYGGGMAYPGRFGHIIVDPDGEPCVCGNRGCWETLVSRDALWRYIRQAVAGGRTTLLTDTCGSDLTRLSVSRIVEAAESGDAVALAALEQIGQGLGQGLASLVNAISPDVVVLGGMLGEIEKFITPAAYAQLEKNVVCWKESACRLVAARFGYDAVVMGGVVVAYQASLPQAEPVVWEPY